MANDVRFRASMEDKVSGKLTGISKAFDKLGGKGSGASLFGNVGAGAVAKGFDLIGGAASAAVGFIFDSIDAASKLQQAVGGVESVFGPAADTVKAFAKTAATEIGLSERAFSESATVIGAKLAGMGFPLDEAATKTIDLEKTAADLAATFGGTTSDAISAISSLLTGERDPIEKYGVSIKEADVQARILALGLDTSTTAAKKQSTAIATLSLLTDATKTATGKFAAEQDTLAGKQQIANAKLEDQQAIIGEKLLPIQIAFSDFMITTGIPMLGSLFDALTDVGRIAGDIVQWFDDIGKAAADATSAIHDFVFGAQGIHFDASDPIVQALGWAPKPVASNSGMLKKGGGGGGGGTVKKLAGGGWAGMNGPELAVLGDGGEPELVVPRSQLRGAGGGGVRIQGISQRELVDMIDRGLYFRLQRASTSRVD